eukprot:5461055-Amphidinium_carterae.1
MRPKNGGDGLLKKPIGAARGPTAGYFALEAALAWEPQRQLSEACVMQACRSSSPFKGTAHDSISPWHLQYLPQGLWQELMQLLNAWHAA